MTIERRREPEIIPQYSLTGDLLSYLRCGLQYRYYSGSSLPPSRPVQQWFGEFIHGVLENAYRHWQTSGGVPPLPWPASITPFGQSPPLGRAPHDIGEIGDLVEENLAAQGKSPRSQETRGSAYNRAIEAVNCLGPHLFPLIDSAEERIIGTREIPRAGGSLRTARYQLQGIIDVLTHVQLSIAPSTNVILQAIQQACPTLHGNYEVIVDYKGSRRPPRNHAYWTQGEWQLQTYAWLRACQTGALPVAAGVLIYINELIPSGKGLSKLKSEIQRDETDVRPIVGSHDEYLLSTWTTGCVIPQFSLDFRLARAIRVIPIYVASQTDAMTQFDNVVLNIEQCVSREVNAGSIENNWETCGDVETCTACDFRHFCTNPAPRDPSVPHVVTSPSAP